MDNSYSYVPLAKAKNTSLWKHFGFKSNDGRTPIAEHMNKVYCTVMGCKHPKIAYNGNTTNMSRHLSQYHPVENAVYIGVSAPTQQLPITAYVGKKMCLTGNKAKEITARIVDCIVEDLRPMAMVEGRGFIKLMATVAPNYPLATADYYTQQVKNRYSVAVATIKAKLETAQWLALTSDIWTSSSQHTYLSLTAHFIDYASSLQTCLLNCVELAADQLTANDIAEAIKQKLLFWGLLTVSDNGTVQSLSQRVYAGVCDNGQNMIKALKEILKLPLVFGCFSHTVNLCVDKGFKARRVSTLISKARHVVEHFSRSSKATYELRDAQRAANISESDIKELVHDVPTRWTATYDLIKRLLELKDHVNAVLSGSKQRDIGDLALTAEDVFQLTELCNALQPICLAMQGMGGEKYCSLSLVKPLLYKLLGKHLKIKVGDTPVVFEFKTAAHADLSNRYQSQAIEYIFTVATFLDPRYKDFKFIKDEAMRRDVIESAKCEVTRLAQSFGNDRPMNAATAAATSDSSSSISLPCNGPSISAYIEPSAKRYKGDQYLYDFIHDTSDDDETSSLSVADENNCEKQLSAYMSEHVDSNIDVIEFWKAARSRYSKIAAVAVKFIAIPATSVPGERLFSTAGLVVSKLRASMSPELVEQILFLNKNWTAEC